VFGLLALESLGEQAARPAVAVIAFTVLLSVVAHGLTAEPLARRYGARLSPAEHSAGAEGLAPIPERRLTRRSHAARHPGEAGRGDGG
jgi:NhaP-type Na+/H+ or K+/H+ antiporter